MAGLPKKYARMGFKKGWAAFKRSKKGSSKSRSTKKRSAPMAKRRRRSTRKTSFRRKKSSGSLSPKDAVLFGLGYGAVRQPISDGLKKITGSLPVIGDLGDEVALGALHYFAAKGNWFGMRKLWIAGLTVESSRVGANIAGGTLSGLFGGSTGDNL